MQFTQAQQQAIDIRGGNLLLSAAAGSGKTTVLVSRVLKLIEEGANVDEMLIVTFSRAAAADMRQKLTRQLTKLSLNEPRFRTQLDRMERASISTLHSFCTQLLRAHFEAAQVDPMFRVLDDVQSRQLETHALAETIELAIAENMPGLTDLTFGRDIKKLSALVRDLYTFSQNRADPEAFLVDALLTWPKGDGKRWADALFTEASRQLETVRAIAEYALTLSYKPLGPQSYRPTLEADLDLIDELAGMDYESLVIALGQLEFSKLSPLRKAKDDPDAAMRAALGEQIKQLRDSIKKIIKKTQDLMMPLADALCDLKQSIPGNDALYHLICDFAKRLWAYKLERTALTFSDLEHCALRALNNQSVRQSVRARYQYVFVDEYQDTSDLQEAIISQVSRGDNLFMVGDIKQSIYRFRQAEPTLFIEKYIRYEREDDGRLVVLSQNFRSRRCVIDIVNKIFAHTMSGKQSEVRYDEAAHLRLGAEFTGTDPKTEIHLITQAEDEENELTGAQGEAAFVANRIAQLLKDGIRARDIAIIARTRSSLIACEAALRAHSIPAYADMSEGYLDALEVRIMRALLETIENRQRDFPLLNTLRSPIVGLTTTQLAQIRSVHSDGTFCEAVYHYMENDDETAKKLRDFCQLLERYRSLSRALPLGEFIDLLLRETGFYAYVGGMKGGQARQGNLDLLCSYASAFEQSQSGGVTAFLGYLNEIRQSGGDMDAAHTMGEGDDVVRLMTAHKSKGLEFPIVLCVGLGRLLSKKPSQGECLAHRSLGVGLNFHDAQLTTKRETLPRRAIAIVKAQEELEEEKRVLYVMLTRAMNQLILVGSVPNPEKAQLDWVIAGRASTPPNTYLDMIMPTVGDDARQILVEWHPRPMLGEGVDVSDETPVIPETLIAKMKDLLTWRYPFENEAFEPVKLSVSGLARELTGAHAMPTLTRRPKFMEDKQLSATERGTLTHAALSALDLQPLRQLSGKALRDEVERQLNDLHERDILAQVVPYEPICAFLERDVGIRMRNAMQIQREWPFNLRMSVHEALGTDTQAQLLVQGVVDCCFLEDDRWVLLDYKTDRLAQEEALIARYRDQLALYEKALARITGHPVKETYLCLLGMGKELQL